MKRTNDLHVKPCNLFEEILHLRTVLSDYADIVSSCFARPIFVVDIERAEFAECVGGEKHLVRLVVSHDNFGPMHHGCGDKRKLVFAGCKRAAVANNYSSCFVRLAEIVLHHRKSLLRGHDRCARIYFHKLRNVCRMVWFHVLHDKVIGGFAV